MGRPSPHFPFASFLLVTLGNPVGLAVLAAVSCSRDDSELRRALPGGAATPASPSPATTPTATVTPSPTASPGPDGPDLGR